MASNFKPNKWQTWATNRLICSCCSCSYCCYHFGHAVVNGQSKYVYKWGYAADVDGDDLSGTRNGFYHANLSIMLTNVASNFISIFFRFFCTLIIHGSLGENAGGKNEKLKDYNYRFVHFYEVYLFSIQFNCYLIILINGTIQTQSRCGHTLTWSAVCAATALQVNENNHNSHVEYSIQCAIDAETGSADTIFGEFLTAIVWLNLFDFGTDWVYSQILNVATIDEE